MRSMASLDGSVLDVMSSSVFGDVIVLVLWVVDTWLGSLLILHGVAGVHRNGLRYLNSYSNVQLTRRIYIP